MGHREIQLAACSGQLAEDRRRRSEVEMMNSWLTAERCPLSADNTV
jgi:hypothetical protein